MAAIKFKLTSQLTETQQYAVDRLVEIFDNPKLNNGAVLSLKPGEGKTLTALQFAALKGLRILAVTPISTVQDLVCDSKIHFDKPMSTQFIGSRNHSTCAAHTIPWCSIKDADVTITNYDMLVQAYNEVVEIRTNQLTAAIESINATYPSTKDTSSLSTEEWGAHDNAMVRRACLQECLSQHLRRPSMDVPIPDAELAAVEQVTLSTSALRAIYYHTWDMVLMDEGDKARTPSTLCYLACTQLRARFHLCITATPFNNRIGDLESMFTLAHVMPADGVKWTDINNNIDMYCDYLNECKKLYLLQSPDDQSTRRKYQPVDVIIREQFHTHMEYAMYDYIKRTVLSQLNQTGINMLEGISRFRQAALGIYDQSLYTENFMNRLAYNSLKNNKFELKDTPPTKICMLISLLPIIISRKEKAIVFVSFKQSVVQIEQHVTSVYPMIKIYKATGDTSQEDRKTIRDDFYNYEGAAILVTVDIFQAGVNLHAANHVILYDNWWNPVDDLQKQSRTERPGQTRSVFTYRLIVAGTIEDDIYMVANAKREISEKVLRQRITPQLVKQITSKNALMVCQDQNNGSIARDIMALIQSSDRSELLMGRSIEDVLKHNCHVYVSNTRQYWMKDFPPTKMLTLASPDLTASSTTTAAPQRKRFLRSWMEDSIGANDPPRPIVVTKPISLRDPISAKNRSLLHHERTEAFVSKKPRLLPEPLDFF
jgi:superfamily II DNA or RNA helicase